MIIRKNLKYSVISDPGFHDGYTPYYSMLIYKNPETTKAEAIKVRQDIIIEKLWNPAVQSQLPEAILKETDGRYVFAFPVSPFGELHHVPYGGLYIYDGKVKGLSYVPPLQVLKKEEHILPSTVLFEWMDGPRKYTLIDYEDAELVYEILKGTEKYKKIWEE